VLFGSLVASQVAYSRLPAHRLIPATRGIVGLMLTTSTAEAMSSRGPGRGGALVGSAGALGFATELVGVATGRPFGHYTYSGQLGPRVAGVPVAAAAAWAMMARPSWTVAGLVAGPHRLRRVLLAAGALTAWDVFLDPRMARDGYWSWPGGGRYEGIPASNFAGWFVTSTAVFAVWSVLDREDAGPADDGALALYVWTWIGETFAHAAIWQKPVVAAAGGASMGAVAVPALVARRRMSPAGDVAGLGRSGGPGGPAGRVGGGTPARLAGAVSRRLRRSAA
jgi:putative membrane protein